jgi:CHAT domain-containing protein
MIGTGFRPDSKLAVNSQPANAAMSARRKALRDQLTAGAVLFQATRYEEARQRFEQVRQAAIQASDPFIEIRSITNIGGCWFALHQYNLALKSFSAAQQLAERTGDQSASAALEANVASLYSELGERDAAVQWLEKSLDTWTGKERINHLPQLEFEMASLRARQDRMVEARKLFSRGVRDASRSGNQELVAVGCNKFGEELLRAGQTDAAEGPLLHAYYLRKLNHLPLEGSYTNLGKLRLAQGRLEDASALLDRGVAASEGSGAAMPTWDAHLARGEVRLAQGHYAEALADLRIARRLAQAWRWSLPPDDASHVGAEGLLDRIYSGLVEAGNRLYLETGDPALVRETFEAAEENRAFSLRMLVQGRQPAGAEYPASYWEAVARLQKAEVNALRGGSQEAVDAARAEWIREQAAAAPDLAPLPNESLQALQAALHQDTVMLSVRLGKRTSWIWAVDREGLALYALPPQAEIERLAAQATDAIRGARAGSGAPGELYRMLFGPLETRYRDKARWLLAMDPALLEIPVSALQVEAGTHPVYVAQRHVVETIPGAGFWLESAARSFAKTRGLFLGVGDPIYNLADSRLPRKPEAKRSGGTRWALFADTNPASAMLTLPRLVGSGAEVERCARKWNGERVVLEGSAVSAAKVQQVLEQNPAVAHFAIHFVQASQPGAHGLMALGFGNGSEPELIAPVEVSHWRTEAGLVVLSGCDSAAGEALPGAGLMGLTRAWLSAGARSVLASRWNTPDEDSALFAAFYREYSRETADAAAALGRAQQRMIQSGGWRAHPAYWGAWFVVGQ